MLCKTDTKWKSESVTDQPINQLTDSPGKMLEKNIRAIRNPLTWHLAGWLQAYQEAQSRDRACVIVFLGKPKFDQTIAMHCLQSASIHIEMLIQWTLCAKVSAELNQVKQIIPDYDQSLKDFQCHSLPFFKRVGIDIGPCLDQSLPKSVILKKIEILP